MGETLQRLKTLAAAKLRAFSEQEQEKINVWLREYTLISNLSTLTRVDARLKLLESLADETVRIYLLELSVVFYAYGGENDDFEERLVNSLAEGLRFEGRDPTLCELPPEVLVSGPLTNFPHTSLPAYVLRFMRTLRASEELSLHEYLLSNRHIQLVVMLTLAVNLEFSPPNE